MEKRRWSGGTWGLFFLLLVLFLGATAFIEATRQSRELEQMKYIASTVSAQTYELLSAKLDKSETLEALLIQNDGGTDGFSKVASFLVSDSSVRNVLLAPGGVVSDVYPLEGNEDVLGHDLTGEGAGDKEAQAAIERGELILAGPFELVQGGMGLAGRLPVYIDGTFWGLVSVTLSYPDALLGMSSMQNLDAQGFGCELWRINPDTGGHQSILSVGTAVNVPTYETAFPIFNAEWQVTVFPSKPWYAHASPWLFVFASLVLSFAGAMGQASLRTIRRMEKQMAEGQIRELQSQLEYDRMNVLLTQIRSHFFYHTMSAIQALIRLNPDAAYKMTGDFSRFLRFKVDSVGLRGGLVSFRDEMRSVQAYADINAVQLGERLHMEYDIFDTNFMIPVLTIQPVVENAIVHGIKPKVGGGTVRVSLLRNDGFYEVTVEDDGVGFSPGDVSGRPSVGLANIRARLEKHPGCSITVESAPGKGTRVVLRFPGNLGKERPR